MLQTLMDHLEIVLEDLFEKNAASYLASLVTIVLVIASVRVIRWLSRNLTTRLLMPREGDREFETKQARQKTLLPLVLSVERYVIYFLALMIVLKELGIDTTAVLASAGVLGLAVGFGAQNTVKDFISGFFLIFDGLVLVGDVITIGSVSGVVEKVDLRNTMVREFNGRLWTYPNGEVRSFGNLNRGWGRAIAEVGMAYEQPIEKGMSVLRAVAEAWAGEFKEMVIEPPEVQGVIGLNDSSVGLRIVVKVKPMQQAAAERELLRRIKDAFDENGLEIPYPKQVVHRPED